jgi:hypothetical protein
MSDLERMSTSQLVDRFEQVCVAQDDALLDDALARLRRLLDQMRAIVEELQSRPGDQRTALMPLYEHPNRQVRIQAAIHTLALAPKAARAVLEEIKAAQWYPQALDAGMMLRALKEGSYEPT